MTAHYSVRRGKTTRFSIQPPTMQQFGLADERALQMQTQLRKMGISRIRVLDGDEGYQALDMHGLVKYQWRTVDELLQLMLAERGRVERHE